MQEISERPDSDLCTLCGMPWRDCECLGPGVPTRRERDEAAERELLQRIALLREAIEWAWVLIAGAYNGNWNEAPVEWQTGAANWRDRVWCPNT